MRRKAKIGTCEVQRCVFCKYWIGDAAIKSDWIDAYTYERTVTGICRLRNDAKVRADDVCRDIDVMYAYL